MSKKTKMMETVDGHGFLGSAGGKHVCSCGFTFTASRASTMWSVWKKHLDDVKKSNAKLNSAGVQARQLASDILQFARECDDDQHMDTGRAGELLKDSARLLGRVGRDEEEPAAAVTPQAHTPGPWYTDTRSGMQVNAGYERGDSPAFWGIGNGSFAVARALITGCVKGGEAQANARLIAAAPELLAALKRMEHLTCLKDYSGLKSMKALILRVEGK